MDAFYLNLQRCIAVIIFGGSLAAIVFNSDSYFPFSNYPMYSRVFTPSIRYDDTSIRAEFDDGTSGRISIGRVLYPFNSTSYLEALFVERDPKKIQNKLQATLDWYNREARNSQPSQRKLTVLRANRTTIPWDVVLNAQKSGQSLEPLRIKNSVTIVEAHAVP